MGENSDGDDGGKAGKEVSRLERREGTLWGFREGGLLASEGLEGGDKWALGHCWRN